jgi:hypothetical protein
MGFYAFLEVDNGESLSIDDENGLNVGAPLVAYLGTYQSATSGAERSAELRWFTRLEEQSSKNLRILTKIFYGEDLLYSADEYKRFLADWSLIVGRVSEEEFKQSLENRERMWASIDEILPITEEIIRLLPQMGVDTHWYTAGDTQPAFQALLNTLKRAQNEDGKKVRILIR